MANRRWVFRQGSLTEAWEAINARLRSRVRATHDKRSRPTAAILVSQSVKSDPHGGQVGSDAAKRIKGRKRHLLVDTLALWLGVELSAADVPERQGAQRLLDRVLRGFTLLRSLWVDGGYRGEAFAQWGKQQWPRLEVEMVKRSDEVPGFTVLPRRWVAERTFCWLMRHWRLVRNDETIEQSAAAWILLAMIRIKLRRLA